MGGRLAFFDVDERPRRLSGLGDHLEAFAAAVDFEMFRVDLVAALGYSDGAQGGRPPFDPVMMFMYGCPRLRKMFSNGSAA
ncbi:MAG: hypothetical protein N2444_03840 [Methylocystis sp.]|nr:hypothetical protein [Methylocystis sp.]